MRRGWVLEFCIISALGIGWSEVSAGAPLFSPPLGKFPSPGPADVRSTQASWGIEQKEVAACFTNSIKKKRLTNSIKKGICHSASPPVPPRLLSQPFPLPCLCPLITEFTDCPTGGQKSHFRFGGEELFMEEKKPLPT